MYFYIICNADNRNIEYVKKQRFYLEKSDSKFIYFRKALNHIDDFLQECFITPDGLITHQNEPNIFNQYLKLSLRNKCSFDSGLVLSKEIRECLIELARNDQYVSFFYGEEPNNFTETKISLSKLESKEFYIDFEKRYFIQS